MSLTSCCCNCKGRIISSSLPEKYDFKHGVDEANFLVKNNRYSGIRPFRAWIQMVLPQVYDDALSYQELVYKLLAYINTLIADVDACEENISALQVAFEELQCFVNCYFKRLDLTGEVEKKLDEMSLDGTLGTLMGQFFKVGSGIQTADTTEGSTTTTTIVEQVENYPQCCCCCDCCDSCPYYKLADGDTVVSTYTGDGIYVKTTISRSGDEITTVKETTTYVTKRIIYSDLAEGTGISIDPDSNTTAGTQTISMNVDSDGNSGVTVVENEDGSVSYKLNLTDGDGIETSALEDGSVQIKSLIKSGSGIQVKLDEDDNYYQIINLANSSLSDSLTAGTDYVYTWLNDFYRVRSSPGDTYNATYYKDYEHYTGGVHSDALAPTVKGAVEKNSDGDVVSLSVQLNPGVMLFGGGSMADSDNFLFRHSSSIDNVPESRIIDFYFIGDFADLSDPDKSVSTVAPDNSVWNIQAVGGDPSVELTSSNYSSLQGFGASWYVTYSVATYTGDDGLRHFVITATSIGDGYNTQYSHYGDYVYGSWLNCIGVGAQISLD